MRNTYGALILGFLVAACGGGAEEQPPVHAPPAPVASAAPPPAETAAAAPPAAPKASAAELQAAAMKAYQENFADGKKIASLYAEDATLWVAGTPEVKGRDAILQSEVTNKDPQSNLKIGFSRTWTKGDMVVVEWVVTGTQSKEWNGIPATEKPWGVQGASVLWYNQDGLITKDHRYFDIGTILSQIGVSKQKGRPIPALPTSTDAKVAKGDATEDKVLEQLKAQNATFEKKDIKGFLEPITDDSLYDDYTMPSQMKGKLPAKQFFEGFTKAFPDVKSDVSNTFAVADFAFQEYAMTGTQKAPLVMGPGMTIPNTKKTINYHAFDIMQMKDGKLVHGYTYANGLEFATQLGLVPLPKADKGKAGAAATPAKAGDKPAAAAKPAADKPAAPKPADKAAPAPAPAPAPKK